MPKLYFRHGAMGSSKTANALMVEYNYYERGKRALLLKPKLDDRDGERRIKSRMGLESPCSYVEEFVEMSQEEIKQYDCVIVDEVCWCGEGACCNARFDSNGKIVRKGEQVCLGGNDRYIALCRKHYERGDLGPWIEKGEKTKNEK